MSRALAAELFKLRTTRTNWGVVLGALALVVIISSLAALFGEFAPDDAPLLDLLEIAGLVQIFALVLGILMVTTEYRHGTITPSLLAVPDRVTLVGAKLIAALAAGLVLGLLASLLSLGLVSGLLSARGIETGGTEGVSDLVIGNTIASALFAAIGIGLGGLLRNQVGAIIGSLGWFFLVEPLLSIIPGFEDVRGQVAPWRLLERPDRHRAGFRGARAAARRPRRRRLRGGVRRGRAVDGPPPRRQRLRVGASGCPSDPGARGSPGVGSAP